MSTDATRCPRDGHHLVPTVETTSNGLTTHRLWRCTRDGCWYMQYLLESQGAEANKP